MEDRRSPAQPEEGGEALKPFAGEERSVRAFTRRQYHQIEWQRHRGNLGCRRFSLPRALRCEKHRAAHQRILQGARVRGKMQHRAGPQRGGAQSGEGGQLSFDHLRSSDKPTDPAHLVACAGEWRPIIPA